MTTHTHHDLSRRERQIVDILYRQGRATAAEVRAAPPTDFHSPCSTDSSNSFSSASIFIVGLLTQVLLRGLPARDDRLQKHRVLVLDARLRAKHYGETSP